MIDFSLVIPFYNEEKNVSDVCSGFFEEFGRQKLNYEIIAVNNGSFDKTGELLAEIAKQKPEIFKIVRVEVNQGYGYGVLQGLKTATGEYIGFADGDDQISAHDIFRTFKRAKEENLDYCQGRRTAEQRSLVRQLNTKAFNFIFHLFWPTKIHDIGCKPKITKKTWYDKLSMVSKDWFVDCEIILKSYLLKGKTADVDVISKDREKGRSNIRISSAFIIFFKMVAWKIKTINGRF